LVSRSSDRADAELLSRDRVDFGVTVARDQDLGTVAGTVEWHQRRQEMLAVPHREDERQMGLDRLVDVRRLGDYL